MKNKIILTLLLAFMANIAMAATTGTVIVNGKVPVTCDISITSNGADDGTDGNQDIEDISIGATDRTIATVRETCNEFDGYTVTIAGTNSGSHTGLFIDSISTNNHPFTIKYGGAALSSTTATDASTRVTAASGFIDKTVQISYGSNAALAASDAFTYTETLTFTISAK